MPHPPARLAALRTLLAARFPEKTRGRGCGVPTGVASIDEALGGRVRVTHGANDHEFDGLAGKTVASVRKSLASFTSLARK